MATRHAPPAGPDDALTAPAHALATKRPAPSPNGGVTGWAVAVAFSIVGGAMTLSGWPLGGGIIAVIGFGPLYYRLDRSLFPPLWVGPMTLVYVYHLLGYALGPWWELHMLPVQDFQTEGFSPLQWAAVVGMAVFAVIYPRCVTFARNRWPGRTQDDALPITDEKWDSWGYLLLAVAVANIAYGFATGAADRLGGRDVSVGVDTASAAFQLTHQIMFFFLAYSASKRGGRVFALWLFTLLCYVGFFFLDGGRATVALALIMSGVGFVWGGTSRRRVTVVAAVICALFVPASGFIQVYRDVYIRRDAAGFESRVGVFSDTITGEGSGGLEIVDAVGVFARRVTAANGDIVFLQTPGAFPYAGVEGFSRMPYAMVPTLIFPNRPNLRDGPELAIRYGGAPPGTTGVYTPAAADGYRRFGWLGVWAPYAFAAVVFGLGMGITWAKRDERDHMATFMVMFVICSEIWIFTILTTAWHALWSIPKYAIFYLVLRWLHDRMTDLGRASTT